MKKNILFPVFFFLTLISSFAQKPAVIPYVSGVPSPIDLKHCGDDRLFVLSRVGSIYIIQPDGTLNTTPFLDIQSKISSTNSEEGMLGLAFSPDYATSGKFYVNYTSNAGGQLHSVIEEYKVSASDPDVADAGSALIILTQDQPYSNHNGGNLMFGPDGYLYINFGDGGSGGDPLENGQDLTTFLGKILRIDVSASSVSTPYTIPSSNPFYNSANPNVKKEIWAYGLRNPWRSSFDRITGDLWIADVGQGQVEEIDFAPASDPGGHNYGWDIMEGSQCFEPSSGCNTTGLTLPIYSYTHSVGNSITGGYVYRSAQSAFLFGIYIYSDFGDEWIDGIREENGSLSGDVMHLITAAGVPGKPISFGQDRYGDLYVLLYNDNTVYKFADTSYLLTPKAFFTGTNQGGGNYLLDGLEGKALTYQWYRDGSPIAGATLPDYTTAVEGVYTLQVSNSLGHTGISEEFTLGPLPVTMTSFHAAAIENYVILNWVTASESNVKGFAMERKYRNENQFIEIGFVSSKAPAGNASNAIHYSYKDEQVKPGQQVFYRIKILDKDGRESYSGIVNVEIPNQSHVRVYPNPATNHLNIRIDKNLLPANIRIVNDQGGSILVKEIHEYNTQIPLQQPTGIYFLLITSKDGSTLYSDKIIIK